MQSRGLLIALTALAALSGALWWTNRNPSSDSTKISDAKREQLLTLLEADLTEVTVARKGEAPLVLRRNAATQWEMVLDPPLATSHQDAADVVTNVATISADQIVEESATDLIQFGLDPGEFTLTVKNKKGQTQQLLVGDATPVGSKVYARRPNEKKVFAIPQYFKTGFDKRVNDLRDKRLLPLDDAKLSRLELKRGSEFLEFTRNSQNLWQMQKPQPYRTDAVVVDELISKLKDLKFDPSLSDEDRKKTQAAFASATPLATLVLTDGAATKQLVVKKAKEGDLLAQSSLATGAHKISADLAPVLEKKLDDFRTRKLFDFGFDDPQRIQVDSAGKTSTLDHKGEDWFWNGSKADPATVTGFLEALRGFSALSFVEKKFTTPSFTVVLTQKDGKTIEKLEISRSGNFHYIRRVGEAGEYEIDPKTLSDLESAMGRIKPATSSAKK